MKHISGIQKQEDILKIREELLKKHDSVTFYNIHNEWAREDFRNWKDSLVNYHRP
jgi:hypothetical protein